MFKLDLEKGVEAETNCQDPLDHRKRKRIPGEGRDRGGGKASCFTDYVKLKPLCGKANWKILK